MPFFLPDSWSIISSLGDKIVPKMCRISGLSVFSYKVFAGCLYAHIKEGRHCEAIRARSLSPPTPTSMDTLGRLRCSRQTTCKCMSLVLAASTLPPECKRQTRARTLSPPLPYTVEQPQACSISRRSISGSVAHAANQLLNVGGKHFSTGVPA